MFVLCDYRYLLSGFRQRIIFLYLCEWIKTHLFFISAISFVFLFTYVSGQQLLPYESLTHFDVEKYSKQYERAFDASGIITQKKEYHALTIGVYGIMNYDAFKATGDSIYYKRVINQ